MSPHESTSKKSLGQFLPAWNLSKDPTVSPPVNVVNYHFDVRKPPTMFIFRSFSLIFPGFFHIFLGIFEAVDPAAPGPSGRYPTGSGWDVALQWMRRWAEGLGDQHVLPIVAFKWEILGNVALGSPWVLGSSSE